MSNDLPLIVDIIDPAALTHSRLLNAFKVGCPNTASWVNRPGSQFKLGELTKQLGQEILRGLQVGIVEAIVKRWLPNRYLPASGGERIELSLCPSIDFIVMGDIVQRIFIPTELTIDRPEGRIAYSQDRSELVLNEPSRWLAKLVVSITEVPEADVSQKAQIAPQFERLVWLPKSIAIRAPSV